MTIPPNAPVEPADAVLLRECADVFRWEACDPDRQGRDIGDYSYNAVHAIADRLRALADVLERMGQKCGQCGLPHMVDTSLPSDIWNRIAQPHEMLCPLCIDERLVRAGIRAQAKFYCVGEALSGHPYP